MAINQIRWLEMPDGTAYETSGFYYVESSGSTAGIWLGTNTAIKEYYNGLTIIYKVPTAGGDSETTLNINNLGAKTIYVNGSSKVTTNYDAGSMILLTYIGSGAYIGWHTTSAPETTDGVIPHMHSYTPSGVINETVVSDVNSSTKQINSVVSMPHLQALYDETTGLLEWTWTEGATESNTVVTSVDIDTLIPTFTGTESTTDMPNETDTSSIIEPYVARKLDESY